MRPALLVPALLAAAPALADPIDGTWKSDLAGARLSTRPDVYLLANGSFTCASCVPAYTLPADGGFHPVKGQDYWDEGSVTVVDDRTVDYAVRRGGKLVGTMRETVSADGATLTDVSRDTGSASGVPVENTSTSTRVAAVPAGAHATSGSWKRAITRSSEAGINQTFKLDGTTLRLTTLTGESYAARLGGPAVPMVGDAAGTMVRVRRVGASYEETGSRAGKPVYRMTFTPSADGRTLAVTSTNLRTGGTTGFTAVKQ